MDWNVLKDVLVTIGAPTLIYFLFTTTINRRNSKKDKQEEVETDLQKQVREISERTEQRVEEIEKHLAEHKKKSLKQDEEILKQLKEKEDLIKAVDAIMLISNRALQSILRQEIIKTYNIYTNRKYMPIYERESLDSLFSAYESLGGNGMIKDLVEKIRVLPTEPPEE